jgi:VWFA-related protein
MSIHRQNFLVSAAFGLAVLLLLPDVALTQSGEPPSETPRPSSRRHGIFLDTVDVTLINVEVVVTDRKGEPIHDLTIDDFEILDDGEPVEITNFYRVEGGRRAPSSLQLLPEGETPPPAVAEEYEPFSVIILVDDVFITPQSRKRIFNSLSEQLDKILTPGTQVMVARLDPEIKIEQRFSKDRAAVATTLKRLANIRRSPFAIDKETSFILRDIAHSYTAGASADGSGLDEKIGMIDATRLLAVTRTHIREVNTKVMRTTEVIGAFLGSIAGMPGRKALLYVSDILPVRPGERVMVTWWEKFGDSFSGALGVMSVDAEVRPYDTTQRLYDLIANASASRVVFYPVGAGMSDRLRSATAEVKASFTTGSFANDVTVPATEGLRLLALGTGGEAALEVASPEKLLVRMRNDLTHYYSLAYPSPHRGDGKRHKLKVRVSRPGADVRYLEGYRDKDVDQQMEDRTLASLLFDTVENPLGVRVQVGEAEKQKRNRFIVPIQVRLPVKNLVLLPEEDFHVGRVSIFIVARDENGRMSKPQKIVVPIEVPVKAYDEAMKRGATYSTRLAVRSGEQTIAVGVRDEVGAVSSTVPVYINVGEKKGKGKGKGKDKG